MKCPNCGREMRSKVRDYEYNECGLKGVVLGNITVHECPRCGEVLPEIPKVKQIHKWLAEYLVKKQSPLTGEEFRFLRKTMLMSAGELARVLAVTPVTISRWENNRENVGPQSDRLLRALFVVGPERRTPVLRRINLSEIFVHIASRKPRPERIFVPPLDDPSHEKEERAE